MSWSWHLLCNGTRLRQLRPRQRPFSSHACEHYVLYDITRWSWHTHQELQIFYHTYAFHRQYCCKQLTAKCLHLGESEVRRCCRRFCKVTKWLVRKQNCRLHLPSGSDSSLYRRTTGEFPLLFQNWLLGDVPLIYFAITQWEIPHQPFLHFFYYHQVMWELYP